MSAPFASERQAQPSQYGDASLLASAPPRLESIDLMRGIVIVLMALDHTKDYFGGSPFDPLDADVTNLPAYLTRWLTHFCAPTFCFLMGTGAYLAGRQKSKSARSRFLLGRGLWLVLLDLTVIKFALQLDFSLNLTIGLVLWSLGWSLVFLSVLVFLPSRTVGAIGVIMIVTHNLFDGVTPETLGPLGPLWVILHQRGLIALSAKHNFLVAYPLLPWFGVAAAGFGFGEIMTFPPKRRQGSTFVLGLSLTLAFFVLRSFDGYGDPLKWAWKTSVLRTCFSFFNCQKYPASLLFLLMTIGPMLILMSFLEKRILPIAISRFLLTFGRVPLFFFLTHLYVIRAVAIIATSGGLIAPSGTSSDLPTVYVWFVVVLILMYGPCRWYARIKGVQTKNVWLSYL
jgi:uncharacterized membrane protein